MLGKVGFGELGIIQNTVGLFGTFAGFGLGLTATKFIAEFCRTDPSKAGRIRALSSVTAWITSGLAAGALVIFSPWLARHTLAAPQLAGALRVGALFLLLTTVNGAQMGALSGFEAFRTIAKINLVAGVLSFPAMLAGVYYWGLPGAIWALVFSAAINWYLSHVAVRRECHGWKVPFSYKGLWSEAGVIWTFSLPSVLAGAATGPVMWAANAILVNQPGGYAEMGLYNAALRIQQVPQMILALVLAPLLPVLSEQFGKRATADYNKTLRYAFTVSLLVIVPVSLLQAIAPTLTLLAYGRDYSGNEGLVIWLMLYGVLIGLFSPFSGILASMNRMWFGTVFNFAWGALYLLLCLFLVPKYGSSGLAATMAVTHLATSIPCLIYIRHKEKAFVADVPLWTLVCGVLLLFGLTVVVAQGMSSGVRVVMGATTALLCAYFCVRVLRGRSSSTRA
jgi:O-antigen/teichoic acid export membrane protein